MLECLLINSIKNIHLWENVINKFHCNDNANIKANIKMLLYKKYQQIRNSRQEGILNSDENRIPVQYILVKYGLCKFK